MDINDYFEKIYCINLDNRKDRWQLCQEEFEKVSIKNIERFSAIDGKTLINQAERKTTGYWSGVSDYYYWGNIGCILSHMALFENMSNRVLILEDDVLFAKDFCKLFKEISEYIPEKYDMLYLGGHHCPLFYDQPYLHSPNDHIRQVSSWVTTGAYSISPEYAKKMIKVLELKLEPIDITFARNHITSKSFVTNPIIAAQRIDRSDIIETVANHFVYMSEADKSLFI